MKDTSFFKNKLIAHRGLYNNDMGIIENSIPAFKNAIKNNLAIELDVHLTKDNKVVVFHDNSLKRICGVKRIIEECTYDELLKYNLYNTKYKIPLLKEVLLVVDGKVPILIETKIGSLNNLELELSKILDNYNGLFLIQSFNIFSIQWFKKNRKNYIVGLLINDIGNIKMFNLLTIRTLLIDVILKCDFIAYNINDIPNTYTEYFRRNKLIISWTIKNKKEFNRAKKYSDSYICDNIKDYYV